MERDWTRILLTAYGFGLLIISFCMFDFYLMQFGHGGVPEYRGRMATFDKYFPADHDYILFNHGSVTPVSKDYYDLIQRAESVTMIIYFAALPLLVGGLFGCARAVTGSWNPLIRGGTRWQFGIRLFLPNWHDPAVTLLGKLYFICTFLGLGVLAFGRSRDMGEDAFVRFIVILYCAYSVPALAGMFLIRYAKRIRDSRAVSEATEG